jgi:glycosyltransferase involved in cell wall biosynthesis
MRILMLAQFYPPILGGEERHVHSLSHELAGRGHTVAVGTLQQPDLPDSEADGPVQVHRLPSSLQRAGFLFSDPERRHHPPVPDPEAGRALGRLVEEFRPDIVHAHNWMVYSYLPLKRRLGVPLVLTLHDFSQACAIKRLMRFGIHPCSGPGLTKCPPCSHDHYGLTGAPTYFANAVMNRQARSRVDRYLAVSRATAEGNGLHPEGEIPVRVIPNFLPGQAGNGTAAPMEPHPLTAGLPAPGYLMFAGDLSRDKGVPVLLEAYTRLRRELGPAAPPLVLIGRRTPTTPQELPEGVQAFHSWPHPAVLQAWQGASIALAPSVWPEPFGIVVIEAMQAGVPVVASEIGGLADIVSGGETGLLVPPGDAAALCAALLSLLADPELGRRMGEAGRRRVERYSAAAVVPQIEQVYQELLGDPAPAGEKGGQAKHG